jgi:hypothetical protein
LMKRRDKVVVYRGGIRKSRLHTPAFSLKRSR